MSNSYHKRRKCRKPRRRQQLAIICKNLYYTQKAGAVTPDPHHVPHPWGDPQETAHGGPGVTSVLLSKVAFFSPVSSSKLPEDVARALLSG